MKQQFLEDIAETFKTYIYEDNRKLVVTSATLTVYKPGTDTKLLDGVSMTVGGDGLLSYDLTGDNNDIADENYKAVIAYVSNAVTFPTTLFYDVVKVKLHKVITDQDIIDELPQLRDSGWSVEGTADSGSTTTIVDAELIDREEYPDNHFMGGKAYSIDRDETRDITDFVSSTGTVTTKAFSGAIATDKYVLTRSFTREIQRAFEKIEDRLNRMGRRAHLILDPYDLREAHTYQTVADICKGMATDVEGTIWWEFMNLYEMKVNWFFKNTTFKYDISEDGFISGSEEDQKPGRKTIARG